MWRHLILLTLSLFLIGGVSALTAYAQTDIQAGAQTEDTEKIPEEYLQEANEVYSACANDYNESQYFNCECLSLSYLDERIRLGPTASSYEVRTNLGRQCFDAINAAGPTYDSCIRKANRLQPGTDPELYCECVANTYVRLLQGQKPRINSKSITYFRVEARKRCSSTF